MTFDSSEERFRLLMEAVSDYAIYMLDPDGNVTTWNTGAAHIKGYAPREIIGRNFSVFFTAEDARAGKPQNELERARREGRFAEEGWRLRKDGSRFWASVVVTPVRDARGDLLGFAKVTRDLTARKEAEQTAHRLAVERAAREAAEAAEGRQRENEARYRALSKRLEVILEGLADGVAAQKRDGELIFANKAAAFAMGFSTVEACMASTVQERANRFELLDEHGAPVERSLLPGPRVLRGEPACSIVLHVRDRDTGQQWWRNVKATGVLGPDGQPELAIYIWHDVTEDRRREQHESYLAKAASALAESLDYGSTLTTLAGQLVPGLGDWCSIQLLEGAQLVSVAVSHVDPEKVSFAREVSRRYPADPQHSRGVWNVVRTGASELYEDISDAMLAESAQDTEHLSILRAVGMRSVLIVPIRMRERVLGTLTLISAESGRRYDQHDLRLAEELGRRAGSAIENARLYAAQKKARTDLALVARAGEAFSSASRHEDMLHSLVSVALPALGDFAFVELLEGNSVHCLASAHDDPELDALLKATPWARATHQDWNLSALLRGRTALSPDIDDAWMQAVASTPEQLNALRKLKLASLITVPMRSHEQVLGAVTVCFGKSGRRHNEDDLRLLEELTRRAAMSIAQAQLYARAQEAAKSAEEANRLKDEFLATVSHELRTPLNAILGWSALLRTRTHEPALAKPIEIIHRNALAQGKIIEDILDASRIITGKLRLDLKPADLAAIVREAVDVLRPSIAAKNLEIVFVPTGEPCTLLADPDRLQQVVWNVLSNAVKFSEPGGQVRITLELCAAAWVLTVRDTGRGIAPEFLPFVFDRFKQADGSTTRRVGGLGLGLSIVRHLVELHGGSVQATSAGLGKGATVRVSLPIRAVVNAIDDAEPVVTRHEPAPRAETASGVLTGVRVLVVDDEIDARELLVIALAAVGALVVSAASVAEGLLVLQRVLPHVLVSDIGMPDEDGYSFLRQVRALPSEHGGRTPAIALTAYTRGPDRDRALAAGFNTHMGKPVQTDALIAAIAALAAHAANNREQ